MEKCKLEDCEEEVTCCKYCTPQCRRRAQYLKMKLKGYWSKRYQKLKKEWERSPNGARANIPIRNWVRLPKDWQ